VADFMDLDIAPVRNGIFNVTDMAILAGAPVLVAPRPGERSGEGEAMVRDRARAFRKDLRRQAGLAGAERRPGAVRVP
jgi:hypothetical protein